MATLSKGFYLAIDGNNLSAHLTDYSETRGVSEINDTTLQDDTESVMAGLKTGSLDLTGDFSAALSAILDPLVGEVVPVSWARKGNTPSVNNPVYTRNMLVQDYSESGAVNDKITFTLALRAAKGSGTADLSKNTGV